MRRPLTNKQLRFYSRWCGPGILASVLRCSRLEAAKTLADIDRPGRGLSGTRTYTMAIAMRSSSIRQTIPGCEGQYDARYRYHTLAQWLKLNPDKEGVVVVADHFVHVRYGRVVEGDGNVPMKGRVRVFIPAKIRRI